MHPVGFPRMLSQRQNSCGDVSLRSVIQGSKSEDKGEMRQRNVKSKYKMTPY